ncbi:ribonuclease E inhibitor RraB [Marisediminicola sp. LYQ134]|uniref:ribonuclease E inhibitor RraB n=1 Tax=unclassified Marisediminicola TaxID=2618316 RepID=UPI003982F386
MGRNLESQRAMNSEQLAQRIKMGDHLDVERQVEHFAVFAVRANAVAAKVALTAAGFDASIVRRGWSKFEVRARQTTSLDTSTVDGFVCQVFSIVETYRGAYDGWSGSFAVSPREQE